jgi:hypothetical protein
MLNINVIFPRNYESYGLDSFVVAFVAFEITRHNFAPETRNAKHKKITKIITSFS